MTSAPRFPQPTDARCTRCQSKGVFRDQEGDLTCLYCGEIWPRFIFIPPAPVVPLPRKPGGRGNFGPHPHRKVLKAV